MPGRSRAPQPAAKMLSKAPARQSRESRAVSSAHRRRMSTESGGGASAAIWASNRLRNSLIRTPRVRSAGSVAAIDPCIARAVGNEAARRPRAALSQRARSQIRHKVSPLYA